MMSADTFLIVMPLLLIGLGIFLFQREKRISVQQRILDLLEDDDVSTTVNDHNHLHQKNTFLIPAVIAATICLLQILRSQSILVVLVSTGIGIAIGVIINERRREGEALQKIKSIEYFLPLIMERLVMAVEAGLDVIPALKTVVEIEKQQTAFLMARGHRQTPDEVTIAMNLVLSRTEKGQKFEDALKEVAATYNCPTLYHAFLHLGVAQREGGELISPLKELSDATQLQYQDSVEEEIAKLPVKATAPLVLTFAGLILFFLSSPLVQIISFAAKATPK